MLKRGVVLLFVFALALSLFVLPMVLAADLDGDGVDDETGLPVDDGSEEVVDSDNGNFETELDDGFDDEDGLDDGEEFEEDETDILDDVEAEYSDAELRGAGITPDSAFYFVEDSILSRFRDELGNKEKKIAEIREMISKGNIEAARKALEKYKEYADELEKEVDPEKREEARRSAAAIRNALREIESEIPEDARGEFVDDVLEREGKIVTAVEIASKIRELCRTLSELDPSEYGRVCRAGDDAPKWQKRLHSELTTEQEKEAKEFFDIMSQCFRTSGAECRCQDISVSAFADKCAIIAPLELRCNQGDDDACDLADEEAEGIEDLLPEHLLDVLFDIEGEFEDEQFDNRAPRECIEAGATSREACMQIMFRVHAPPECVEALERGEIDISSEREAREACEEIMFRENAPQECIDAGLRSPKECGALMFRENAPQECIDAGLTGESRGDEKKCREIMDNFREGEGRGPPGFAPALGARCNGISDSQERLKCFDEAFSGAMQYREDYHSGPGPGFPPQCREAGTSTREECERVLNSHFEQRFAETKERESQCANECSARGGAWDFSGGTCRCRVEERQEFREEFREFRPPEGEFRPPEGFVPPEGEFRPPEEFGGGEFFEGSEGFDNSGEGSFDSGGSGSEGGESGEEGGSGEGVITGGVIVDNDFFNYYFR